MSLDEEPHVSAQDPIAKAKPSQVLGESALSLASAL